MPELPEVEVVRAGLAPAVTGARVIAAEVRDPRALKRHTPLGDDGRPVDDGLGGHGVTLAPEPAAARAADFERRITGRSFAVPLRRGKFLWIPILPEPDTSPTCAPESALLAHLGMSGQLLLRAHEAPDDRHVRIRLWLAHAVHGELRVDFADQRLFGSLAIDSLVRLPDGGAIPGQAAHIARDPLDPEFDDAAFVAHLRTRGVATKTVLLDQTAISGIGNIYADEALWRARIHPGTPGRAIGPRKAPELLRHVRAVLRDALAQGGTSFDAQYVNVNGQAGYFSRFLHSYGRAGQPCGRCDTLIVREPFMGRSSYFCPRCQRKR